MEKIDLSKLKGDLPFKWKIQGYNKDKTKAQCVAFIDSRDAQRILDEICGVENWQNEFYEVKGKLFCKVGIYLNSQWVWKSDSGALEDSEFVSTETTSKGESSDAFKRACVQWGIGRFLYQKDIVWLTTEEYESNKYKLTEFINNRGSSYTPKTPTPPTDIYVMTQKDVEEVWNGKIYGKNVYLNEVKKTISDEQIVKLKAHPKYIETPKK